MHWVDDSGGVFFDDESRPLQLRGVVMDITEREADEDSAARGTGKRPRVQSNQVGLPGQYEHEIRTR